MISLKTLDTIQPPLQGTCGMPTQGIFKMVRQDCIQLNLPEANLGP